MSVVIMPGQKIKSKNGDLYQVLAIATHSDTKEKLVIYQQLFGDFAILAKPYDSFFTRERNIIKAESILPHVQKNETGTADAGKTAVQAERTEVKADEGKTENAAESIKAAGTSVEGAVSAVLLDFLDADSAKKKLELLDEMNTDELTEKLMNSIEASLDIAGVSGSVEERLDYVKYHLRTHAKYETGRLR